jgi:hypothetical protein
MSEADKRVHCELHGESAACFLCKHLHDGVGCGFHASTEDPADLWPDAWCDACEAAFQREGEWNDSNEPDVRLICAGCYETAKARNDTIPEPLQPGHLTVDTEQLAQLAHASCERARPTSKCMTQPALGDVELVSDRDGRPR